MLFMAWRLKGWCRFVGGLESSYSFYAFDYYWAKIGIICIVGEVVAI
jgi:hypothetical protein